MNDNDINLEAPIYETEENKEGFTYTTFQAFLDSQFRKDLYRAINTDNYEAFPRLEIHKRNIPLWLCNSLYEYACKRQCNRNIVNEIKNLTFQQFITPSQVHLSEGDIVGGWKVVKVVYKNELSISDLFGNGELVNNLETTIKMPELEGYILEKHAGE